MYISVDINSWGNVWFLWEPSAQGRAQKKHEIMWREGCNKPVVDTGPVGCWTPQGLTSQAVRLCSSGGMGLGWEQGEPGLCVKPVVRIKLCVSSSCGQYFGYAYAMEREMDLSFFSPSLCRSYKKIRVRCCSACGRWWSVDPEPRRTVRFMSTESLFFQFCLFIYFWVFVAEWRLSLVAVSGGSPSRCGAQVSHCSGSSCWAWALGMGA